MYCLTWKRRSGNRLFIDAAILPVSQDCKDAGNATCVGLLVSLTHLSSIGHKMFRSYREASMYTRLLNIIGHKQRRTAQTCLAFMLSSTFGSSVTCETMYVGRGPPGGGSSCWQTQIVAARPALMPPWMSADKLSPMCTACPENRTYQDLSVARLPVTLQDRHRAPHAAHTLQACRR